MYGRASHLSQSRDGEGYCLTPVPAPNLRLHQYVACWTPVSVSVCAMLSLRISVRVLVPVCMSTCFKVYVIAQLCPLYAHVRVCPGDTRVFVPVCSNVNAHVSVHSYVFQK